MNGKPVSDARIVFMGTPDFAAETLTALCEAGYTVVLAVTQPDRPKGRKMEILSGPVHAEAVRRGIPVFQPRRVRDPEAVERIREAEPDLIAVAAFGQIIPASILAMPEYGCLNVHASLLPAYRGAAPIQTAILDGAGETGVTIMRMNEGLDTGDIITQRAVQIAPEDTGGSLFDKLSRLGADLLVETIPAVISGTAVYTPQPAESTTGYASLINRMSGKIGWSRGAEEIERLIRAMNPWPSAWTLLDGKVLKIHKAHIERRELVDPSRTGMIVRQDAVSLYIQTGRGILVPEMVQLEGRRRMTAAEFLRGYTIRQNILA